MGFSKRKSSSMVLLSLLIPVGLLATFRLVGVLPEPSRETITVEEVTWELERPFEHLDINEKVENTFVSNSLSARIGAFITEYHENSHSIPFGYGSTGRDGVIFRPYINLTFTQGFIESIFLRFLPLEPNVALYVHSSHEGIEPTGPPLKEYNLSVTEITPMSWAENRGNLFLKAEVFRSPCGLETQVYWVFDDENNQSHILEVTLEITYFNENTYQEITLPITLRVPIRGN